jgi:hypothetical protein
MRCVDRIVTFKRKRPSWPRLAGALILLGLASVCTAPPASASLLGEWRFDEPAGQVVRDGGPFALDGELGASPGPDAADPLRIAGLSGRALRFDGASLARLPDSPQLAPRTLTAEAVVRAPASPGPYRYLVSHGANGCIAGAYGLYTGAAGGVAIYVFDGSRYVVSAAALPADVWNGHWHHVAGTFDGATLRLYLDGRPVGAPMAAPLRIDYGGTSSGVQVAQYVGACDLAFRGDMDLVRLWSSALSAQDVAGIAQADVTESPVTPGTPPQPLLGAVPGTVLPGPAGSTKPAVSRRCTVRVARKRLAAARRVVVRARVTRLGLGHRKARVIARRAGRRRALSSARIGPRGNARLVLRLQRADRRVELRVTGRSGCLPAYVRVTR